MVKLVSERLRTTYASDENLDPTASDENLDPTGSALSRERGRSINYSSSQTLVTYNFECSAVSSSDRMVKPKFE